MKSTIMLISFLFIFSFTILGQQVQAEEQSSQDTVMDIILTVQSEPLLQYRAVLPVGLLKRTQFYDCSIATDGYQYNVNIGNRGSNRFSYTVSQGLADDKRKNRFSLSHIAGFIRVLPNKKDPIDASENAAGQVKFPKEYSFGITTDISREVLAGYEISAWKQAKELPCQFFDYAGASL